MRSWIRGFLDWFLSHNPAAGPNLPDTPDKPYWSREQYEEATRYETGWRSVRKSIDWRDDDTEPLTGNRE